MTTNALLAAAVLAAASATATAALNLSTGFYSSVGYTHGTADTVVSFDWGSDGNLYYMTTAGYPDTAVWQWNGATASGIYANAANFAGTSVVTVGDFVYFNDSTSGNVQNIWAYGPAGGSPSVFLASTTANSGLYSHGGSLFITGSVGFGTNHVYHSALDVNGGLVSSPAADLGETFGYSGPLAFDASGNMFYGPGYGDLSIYQWSAAEVGAAIAGTVPLPVDDALWFDYAADFAVSGATGMVFDDEGNLWATLTDFVNPSLLVRFSPDGSSYDIVATSDERLGDLRFRDGLIHVSSGNQILTVIPEPSSLLLSVLALLPFALTRRR